MLQHGPAVWQPLGWGSLHLMFFLPLCDPELRAVMAAGAAQATCFLVPASYRAAPITTASGVIRNTLTTGQPRNGVSYVIDRAYRPSMSSSRIVPDANRPYTNA